MGWCRKEKLIILEILDQNPNLGRSKFDRIYYSKIDYDTNWVAILKELRKEKLVEENQLLITSKGKDYLKNNS